MAGQVGQQDDCLAPRRAAPTPAQVPHAGAHGLPNPNPDPSPSPIDHSQKPNPSPNPKPKPKPNPNQLLERQPHESPSPKKPSVLFPLCGSSVDLGHLALRGHPVYGVEGVKVAVDQLLSAFGQEGVPLPGAQDHRRQAAAAGLKLRTAVAPGEAGLDTPVELKVGST